MRAPSLSPSAIRHLDEDGGEAVAERGWGFGSVGGGGVTRASDANLATLGHFGG